jgi:hypothetical protein
MAAAVSAVLLTGTVLLTLLAGLGWIVRVDSGLTYPPTDQRQPTQIAYDVHLRSEGGYFECVGAWYPVSLRAEVYDPPWEGRLGSYLYWWYVKRPGYSLVRISLRWWILPLICAVYPSVLRGRSALGLWRAARRVKRRRCVCCGCHLTDSITERCPECGVPVPAPPDAVHLAPAHLHHGVRAVLLTGVALAGVVTTVLGLLSYVVKSVTYATYPAGPSVIIPEALTNFCTLSAELGDGRMQLRYSHFADAGRGAPNSQLAPFEWHLARVLDVNAWRSPGKTAVYVSLPFWIPAVLLAAWPMIGWGRPAWIRRRRWRRGLCLHCGYNLTGNTSGRCPECGTAIGRAET